MITIYFQMCNICKGKIGNIHITRPLTLTKRLACNKYNTILSLPKRNRTFHVKSVQDRGYYNEFQVHDP